MFDNIEHKLFLKDIRIKNMEVMKICLEGYQRTGDESYWEWAKVFGDWSKLYKKQIDVLK